MSEKPMTDMERINAACAKGWRLCPGEPDVLSIRFERALEAALPVLEDVSRLHGEAHPVGCRARPGYNGECSCEIGEARAALSNIADILEGKDAKL